MKSVCKLLSLHFLLLIFIEFSILHAGTPFDLLNYLKYNSYSAISFSRRNLMVKPKKWHEIYPYGTKTGDDEAKVFRALSRHAKFDWRSTGAIVKATGLTREKVEEIIDKYVNKVKPPLI